MLERINTIQSKLNLQSLISVVIFDQIAIQNFINLNEEIQRDEFFKGLPQLRDKIYNQDMIDYSALHSLSLLPRKIAMNYLVFSVLKGENTDDTVSLFIKEYYFSLADLNNYGEKLINELSIHTKKFLLKFLARNQVNEKTLREIFLELPCNFNGLKVFKATILIIDFLL